MITKIALKVIACIEMLEQFNNIGIYLALYTILVEQELMIGKKIKQFAACVHSLLYLKTRSFRHLNKNISKPNF